MPNSLAGHMRKKRRFRRKKTESEMEGTDRFRRKRARLATPTPGILGEDQISELPDEILVAILSHLALREAVGTSVLSKRWRYVWTCMSTLNFDGNANNISSRTKYIKWVFGVLAQHKGPNLDEFRVCYDLNRAYTSHIDDWIEFALSNRVHTIELNLSDESSHPRRRCYTLRPKVMRLNVPGFKSLKTLSLKAVNVGDEAIAYFLSNCPLLERLYLHLNSALRNLKVVRPSIMLRHLEVVQCRNIKTIEICDANLVSFTYDGDSVPYDDPKMFLKNAPQLVEVSINPNGCILRAKVMFPMFSCFFPQLEMLQLTVFHWPPVSLSDYILPELKNLKQFELVVDGYSNDSLLGYLPMIKNWPNLQRFVLLLQSRFGGSHKHDKERKATREDVEEAAKFSHPHLKVVGIAGYCNTCDFELLKQITDNAVTLEKIIIDVHDPDPDIESDEFSGVLQRLRLEQQLRKQVSQGVELVILYP